jgi:hypothetical protein
VFDPGINAISILTKLIQEPIFALAATLNVPRNCETPISAAVRLGTPSGIEIQLDLDFLHCGIHHWDIDMETDLGALKLVAGGGRVLVGGASVPADAGNLDDEYPSIYRRFAELVACGQTEVDVRAMQVVADIFLIAKHVSVEPFTDAAR